MNIPETINISGMEYTVIKTVDPIVLNGQQVAGMIDYRNKTIKIDINEQCEQE